MSLIYVIIRSLNLVLATINQVPATGAHKAIVRKSKTVENYFKKSLKKLLTQAL